MSDNIYDTVNQLAKELIQTDEFKRVEEAYKAMKEDEEAYKTFNEFRDFQIEIQSKQMSGQEVTDEDAAKAQEYSQQMNQSQTIQDLMVEERALSALLNDINRTITQPLTQLYNS